MPEATNVFFYKCARAIVRFLRAQKKSIYRRIVCPLAAALPGVSVFLRNKMTRRWLQDDAVCFVSKILFENENEQEKFFSSVATKDILNAQGVFSALGELQKKKIQEKELTHGKTIALFFASGAYRENTGTIAERLRAKGYNVLILIGEICNDQHERREHVYYGGNDIINGMDFIDVLLEISGTAEKLTRAKRVYFPHDIYDSPLGNVINREGLAKHMAECDYLFLPSRIVLDRCGNMILNARRKFPELSRKNVCLIPGGYIKLDKNLEYFEQYNQDTKTIIYAPTVSKERMGGMGSVTSLAYGDQIIKALLDNFPDYKIVFRPHPHDLHTALVKTIREQYDDNPRFIFDNNQSSYMKHYAASALLITDMSGTAYTYAFTTLQPVLFFSHDEKETKRRFGEFKYFEDREKIGRVAQTIGEMVHYAKSLLAAQDEWTAKIEQHRNSLIYNIGKAEDYFIENFEYIAEAKKHPDWAYI